MFEITPTSELPNLYREYAKQEPKEAESFLKAAEYLETGQISNSTTNWNARLRAKMKEMLKNGKTLDDIRELCRGHIGMDTIKEQLEIDSIKDSTARVVFYSLKG